jgi:hypothetical protein
VLLDESYGGRDQQSLALLGLPSFAGERPVVLAPAGGWQERFFGREPRH